MLNLLSRYRDPVHMMNSFNSAPIAAAAAGFPCFLFFGRDSSYTKPNNTVKLLLIKHVARDASRYDSLRRLEKC